jgi:hypothetical protein
MACREAEPYTQPTVSRNSSDGIPAEDTWSDRATFKGSDSMFPSQVTSTLILRARPDRRADDRYVHSQTVQINGVSSVACDISSKGIAVIMSTYVAIGDIVRVTISDPVDAPGPKTATARVMRIDRRADRFLVGLEFVH